MIRILPLICSRATFNHSNYQKKNRKIFCSSIWQFVRVSRNVIFVLTMMTTRMITTMYLQLLKFWEKGKNAYIWSNISLCGWLFQLVWLNSMSYKSYTAVFIIMDECGYTRRLRTRHVKQMNDIKCPYLFSPCKKKGTKTRNVFINVAHK